MQKNIIFEISGVCNAKCSWCYTSRRNAKGKSIAGKFISAHDFKRTLDRLIELKLLRKDSLIELFNWGEPLLNPEFLQIAKILKDYALKFRISTNASKVVNYEAEYSMENLSEMVISMPGFSESSYRKQHGFEFAKILENIDTIVMNFRKMGFKGSVYVSFHVYQYNLHEIKPAKMYCDRKGFLFNPYMAKPIDFDIAMQYLQGEMEDKEVLFAMTKQLLLSETENIPEMLKELNTTDYDCQQKRKIVLDEDSNILTCCLVPKEHEEYSVGSVFELSKEEIIRRKQDRAICKKCLAAGVSYWLLNMQKDDSIGSFVGSYRDAMKQDKADLTYWLSIGNKHFKNHDFIEAFYCYSRVLEISPEDVGVLFNKARVYEKLGNITGAKDIYQKVLRYMEEEEDGKYRIKDKVLLEHLKKRCK